MRAVLFCMLLSAWAMLGACAPVEVCVGWKCVHDVAPGRGNDGPGRGRK